MQFKGSLIAYYIYIKLFFMTVLQQTDTLVVNLPMGYYKVREIFQKYINGYGLTTIAQSLNKRGIKSP